MKYKWLILLTVLFAFSCGKEKLPKGILPKGKMVPILVDQHLAEVIYNQRFAIGVKDDNAMENLYLSILKKHKVDEKNI